MARNRAADPANPDTIAALATPAGQGGIAILRISGPRAFHVGRSLFRPAAMSINLLDPPHRRLILGVALHPDREEPLDEVLCAFFPGPRSYTTEDCVEVQCHGGPAVVRALLDGAVALGCRQARPSEFTYRAYLGGRLSLDQAEAVAELVAARSESEARLAGSALAGGLARRLEPVRRALTLAAAGVEAAIDFPEDVAELAGPEAVRRLEAEALRPLAALAEEARRWRVFRQGAHLVICGRPNVGKSSLFNALLGRERAIVSREPGTTRDALEEALILGGVACRLSDTAGLGRALDGLDGLGQEAARRRLAEADLALLVLDGSEPLNEEDRELLALTADLPRMVALNKADLAPAWEPAELGPAGASAHRVSAKEGAGLEALAAAAGSALCGGETEPPADRAVANQRQAASLEAALDAVRRVSAGLAAPEVQPELVSLDLAEALERLGEVDGRSAPDDVIEAVFSNFCVGK